MQAAAKFAPLAPQNRAQIGWPNLLSQTTWPPLIFLIRIINYSFVGDYNQEQTRQQRA